jgi:hypothetical protein
MKHILWLTFLVFLSSFIYADTVSSTLLNASGINLTIQLDDTFIFNRIDVMNDSIYFDHLGLPYYELRYLTVNFTDVNRHYTNEQIKALIMGSHYMITEITAVSSNPWMNSYLVFASMLGLVTLLYAIYPIVILLRKKEVDWRMYRIGLISLIIVMMFVVFGATIINVFLTIVSNM